MKCAFEGTAQEIAVQGRGVADLIHGGAFRTFAKGVIIETGNLGLETGPVELPGDSPQIDPLQMVNVERYQASYSTTAKGLSIRIENDRERTGRFFGTINH